MLRFLLNCIVIFVTNQIYSQSFVDSNSKKSISLVEIYSDKGNLIGFSDESGKITEDLFQQIKNTNTTYIFTSHFLYENSQISLDDLKKDTFIYLKPITIHLEEVVIVSKKNNKKYLKLNCYFRSYQINNDRVHYFIDGVTDIYVSNKNNKTKINKIISSRAYTNKKIEQLDEKGALQVYFEAAGVPMIDETILLAELKKCYIIDSLNQNILKDNKVKGSLSKNKSNVNLNFAKITLDNPKVTKALGSELILYSSNIYANFWSSSLNNYTIKDILFYKELKNYKIKNKKDNQYQKVDLLNEIYVIESYYTDDIEETGDKWDFYSIKPSKYSKEYWKEINNSYYQPLPKPLENYINENLTEVR